MREEIVAGLRDPAVMASVRRGLLAAVRPPLVTDLPVAPQDGDEVYYLADSTNGIVWHFRFRTNAPSVYRWEAVGNQVPLFALVPNSEQRTGATGYGDLATVGPSITLPLPGDYDVKIGARPHSGTPNKENWMSYDIGSTGAVDADALDTHTGPSGTFSHTSIHGYREKRKLGLGAVTLTCKYKVQDPADSGWWTERSISAAPIRVGRT
jgi:hypothetical protein